MEHESTFCATLQFSLGNFLSKMNTCTLILELNFLPEIYSQMLAQLLFALCLVAFFIFQKNCLTFPRTIDPSMANIRFVFKSIRKILLGSEPKSGKLPGELGAIIKFRFGAPNRASVLESTIGQGVFGTNSGFHVKQRTKGEV